ncbi:MAG: LysR family transcriptional regulator [Saprospiraceae bacterium]|nr:LysR family transcriptional regulator [Saprospiraceae bacterium]
MEITLQQLAYAIALEKYGNYGQAAKSVGISQPGLSLQIKNLEEKVGIILFDRAEKPIRPTPKGKLFLTRAHLLLTQAKHLEEFMQELEGEVSGEINLGVIPTLAPYFIPLFINDLLERYPKIRLHIKEATTEEIINSLRFGKLHAGIISTPITSSFKFQIQPLFYEKFFLYVSEKHALFKQEKVAVSEIPFEELWLLREGNCFKDQVNNICQYEEEPVNRNFMYECNSIASLCRIVEYQGGITFIPEIGQFRYFFRTRRYAETHRRTSAC